MATAANKAGNGHTVALACRDGQFFKATPHTVVPLNLIGAFCLYAQIVSGDFGSDSVGEANCFAPLPLL